MRSVEQVTEVVTDHGEGPVWSAEWGGLRFVDMLAGGVLTLRTDGTVDRLDVGRVAAMVRPRAGGGYVVATETGLGLAEAPDALPTRDVALTRAPGERMNEGAVAPDGSLYVGSSTWEVTPGAAALYRVHPDLRTERVLEGVTISNGLGFSPDHTRAYYVDSGAGRMDLFDVVSGILLERRPFVSLPREEGDLDGLAVDAQGTIWVAVYGGGHVRRYSPDGDLLEVVDLPVPHVTACTLGGPGLTDLLVTTSRGGLGADAPVGAGAVYRVDVDVPGLPVLPFAG
ncbi:SMP-30/gluconolactonase/LRE family protein [Georgenia wutianyii]|uniref:SMP-30/gluconolactonase/LRE family protein n=1 Tax=Georgenia wutianyii TaxID=2585135 RepID=A0ABX5VKP2_9MICO|nr:SMP-30/gluconolactonase/LRE family protein [Georgenia wutianyii]QDB78999.1 SMP-30/gluconolactonase/LRE family protein [Georgenia wutianyii]